MEQVTAGTTSKILKVTLRDASTGQPLTGVAFGDVTIKAHVGDSAPATLTPVTASVGTFTSEGWVETSDAGQYQFGARNADLSTADRVVKYTFAASGAITAKLELDVVAYDPDDGDNLSLTGVPASAPGANGGMPTVDANNRIVGIQGTKNDFDDLNDFDPLTEGVDVDFIEGTDATDYFDTLVAGITTILNRLGAWTGTGINTLLGAFQALLRSDVSAPSDIGGTFTPASHSTEAIGDAAFDPATDGVDVDFVEGTDATDYFNSLVTTILDKVRKFFQLLMRSDGAIKADNAAELTEINANEGSGAGDFDNENDATEAIRDRGDAAWTTGAGGGGGGGAGAFEIEFLVEIGGTPIPEADVVITQINSDIDENIVDARRSDANGNVTFPGIDAGTYWCHIQKTGGPQPNAALKLTVVDGDNFTFSAI